MIRFLSVLMVSFLVLIQSVPARAATQLIVVPTLTLNPNDTYANAWAAAVNTQNVDPPCDGVLGPGRGVKGTRGSKVTCGPKSPPPPTA